MFAVVRQAFVGKKAWFTNPWQITRLCLVVWVDPFHHSPLIQFTIRRHMLGFGSGHLIGSVGHRFAALL